MSREKFRLLLVVAIIGVVAFWAYDYSRKMERRDRAEASLVQSMRTKADS